MYILLDPMLLNLLYHMSIKVYIFRKGLGLRLCECEHDIPERGSLSLTPVEINPLSLFCFSNPNLFQYQPLTLVLAPLFRTQRSTWLCSQPRRRSLPPRGPSPDWWRCRRSHTGLEETAVTARNTPTPDIHSWLPDSHIYLQTTQYLTNYWHYARGGPV